MSDIATNMLEAIIAETVETLPGGLLSSYRNPPGRRPHDYVKRIQSTLAPIDDDAASELIRDVVDSAVFAMLTLMDSQFKNLGISVELRRGSTTCDLSDVSLHEGYRMRVQPGGHMAAD